MRRVGSCALAAFAAVAALAVASPSDSDSSEELRQALVLVDILRSGMARRKTATVAPLPAPAALPTNDALWLPPYGAPYYGYGAPFRRFYGFPDGGIPDGRRVQNANRQLQYDESFGAHPGDDERDRNQDSTTAQATSKVPDEHSTATSTTATTEPYTGTDAATAAATTDTKHAITTDEVSKTPVSNSVATTAQYTHTSTNVVTKSSNTVEELKPTLGPATSKLKIRKLNFMKEDKSRNKVSEEERKKVTQSSDQIEMSQAAEELRLEATDTEHGVRHIGGGRPWRYRGTTRVHLARSSPPPRPLPANNAYCHTNPASPLCRTFI